MNKLGFGVMTLLAVCFSYIWTCFAFDPSPVAASEKSVKYVWRVGTIAPGNMGWTKGAKTLLIPKARTATDGELLFKVYWGGLMGDEEESIRKMQAGYLEAAGLSAKGAVLICPETAVLELPFLFQDYGEVDYIREKMLPGFEGFFEKKGFKLYLWIDQDFDQIYSVDWELSRLEDFRKAKFITWNGILEKQLFLALGSNCIPKKISEVSETMRTGLADSVIAPVMWMVGVQLHSKVKYVNPVKIRYSPGVIIIKQNAWDSIPVKHQNSLQGLRRDMTREFVHAMRKDNKRFMEAMIAYGVTEVEMTPENRDQIRKIAMTLWGKMSGDLYPKQLLDELLNHLTEYRDRNSK